MYPSKILFGFLTLSLISAHPLMERRLGNDDNGIMIRREPKVPIQAISKIVSSGAKAVTKASSRATTKAPSRAVTKAASKATTKGPSRAVMKTTSKATTKGPFRAVTKASSNARTKPPARASQSKVPKASTGAPTKPPARAPSSKATTNAPTNARPNPAISAPQFKAASKPPTKAAAKLPAAQAAPKPAAAKPPPTQNGLNPNLAKSISDVKEVGEIAGKFLGPVGGIVDTALGAVPDTGPSHLDDLTGGLVGKIANIF
jgi:hypothetical protein